MKFLTFTAPAILLALPGVLSNPLPNPTVPAMAAELEDGPLPTYHLLPRQEEAAPTCPFSATVTASRDCSEPACEDPMFCAAMVELQDFSCDCMTKEPTTTTVTPRCPSDCECTIPTQWVVPKGCKPKATAGAKGSTSLKGLKGPVKVHPTHTGGLI